MVTKSLSWALSSIPMERTFDEKPHDSRHSHLHVVRICLRLRDADAVNLAGCIVANLAPLRGGTDGFAG
jgi:hypothetical protein